MKVFLCTNIFKVSAYADDVIIMVNGQRDINQMEGIIQDFGVISAARVNWEKSEALAIGKWEQGLPVLPDRITWKKGGLKYLGVYLGDAITQQKNWDGVVERMVGRLAKWKWIHSQLSFRGRVLIVNNLVSSILWHKLFCVDPPVGLLSQLQRIFVDFFWDRLHWIPQGVLFLPKDEGGQGLVHLPSRMAAFRLQFIQRFLTGPDDLVWRNLTKVILQRVEGLGLDAGLFFMDYRKLNLNNISPFYCGLFKMWGLFTFKRMDNSDSLFWLLEEPLVKGARLDVTDEVPGLSQKLCASGTVKLGRIVSVAGPDLSDVTAVALMLGQRSIRHTGTIVEKWRKKLTDVEIALLKDFGKGLEVPDKKDPVPKFKITPDLKDMSGPLLDLHGLKDLDLDIVEGKVFYQCCVKVFNRVSLNGRVDTVWKEKLGMGEKAKPFWRVFYKPPLIKKSGDLQWRILHCSVAVNAFISVINPSFNDKCVFCGLRETVFHCFLECVRLKSLFVLLSQVFSKLGEKSWY